MYPIIFYENESGISEFKLMLDEMGEKKDKDSHIQFQQMRFLIDLLSEYGTRIPTKYCKHLCEDIWELRPGHNRVLFFHFDKGVFVLLHMFRKKTNKTPKSEIDKAKRERDDFKLRNGGRYVHLGRL